MKEIIGPPLQTVVLGAFIVGLALVFLSPPSLEPLAGLLKILVGAAGVILATAWITVLATGKEMPEPEFRRLVDRSEALAKMPAPESPPTEFDELVTDALDELPEDFQRLLETTPVVISRRGREHRAYGHYIGDTVARDGYPDRIVIYEDTLERDFGHNPRQLQEQVRRTVRHELAHHLGWDESGVRGLGL